MQLVSHLVCQVCYSRYQVSFYLWQIGPVLKHYKVSKYYQQDCTCLQKKGSLCKHLYFPCHIWYLFDQINTLQDVRIKNTNRLIIETLNLDAIRNNFEIKTDTLILRDKILLVSETKRKSSFQ